jgi:hypothetical protein
MAITLRAVTGSALSHNQLDTNFSSFFYSASVSASTLNLHYTGSAVIGQSPRSASLSLPSSSKWSDITGGGISRNSVVQVTGSFGVTGSTNIFGNLTQGENGLQAYNFSHAEGTQTIASGTYSHAEGSQTVTSGAYSHAEGRQTSTAFSGQYSHAEGYLTIASGTYSHAEGESTVAIGASSHAEGHNTIALAKYQHVQGQYNISSPVESAFIIGNGGSDGSRSNLVFAAGNTVQITGSLRVSGSITGSLFGTASFASTASIGPGTINYLPKFISTTTIGNSLLQDDGTNIVTNNNNFLVGANWKLYNDNFNSIKHLSTNGWNITSWLDTRFFIGTESTEIMRLTNTGLRITGSRNTISGSVLTVIGTGSAQPIFTVQGSQGELFSVTDSLSGSLFSVNDISGLPIMEVFSDNTTLIGNYLDPMLITTAKNVLTNSGSFTIYSLPTASYDTAFFDYSVRSGSNARAGQIMAIQSGSSVNFTEVTSSAFGTTTGISLGVFISGSNMVLTGSAATTAWTIKTIIRSI